jgi:dihydrofolate reductase
MRNLNAALFVSLDGVYEAPQDWHFPYFSEEMKAVIGEAMSSSDALLMGRVTYEEWSAFWPSQSPDSSPMAAYMNQTPKFVVSATLDDVTWENSTLLEGAVAKSVGELKAAPGDDITINGAGTLVRSLLKEGLVDELRLMIHPLAVGKGKRLFSDGDEFSLKLVDATPFSSGVIYARYAPAES